MKSAIMSPMKALGLTLSALVLLAAGFAFAALAPVDDRAAKGTKMKQTARGEFDVGIEPADQQQHPDGVSVGRFGLDKRYHGDLEATAEGVMLTAGTAVEGSAAYVAIERVEGSLHGKQGSFVLQHTGTMERGAQSLKITVVPDSATGELTGLEGRLDIEITEGEHLYTFEYSLPQGP